MARENPADGDEFLRDAPIPITSAVAGVVAQFGHHEGRLSSRSLLGRLGRSANLSVQRAIMKNSCAAST
jgi:hypothetical protein